MCIPMLLIPAIFVLHCTAHCLAWHGAIAGQSLERHRLKIVRERVELKRSMRLQQKQQQRGINAL